MLDKVLRFFIVAVMAVAGAALMQGGYAFPYAWGDYRAMQLHLTLVN